MKAAIASAICRALRWIGWKAEALHIRVARWGRPLAPPALGSLGGVTVGVIGHFFGDPKVGFMVDGMVGGSVDPDVIRPNEDKQ